MKERNQDMQAVSENKLLDVAIDILQRHLHCRRVDRDIFDHAHKIANYEFTTWFRHFSKIRVHLGGSFELGKADIEILGWGTSHHDQLRGGARRNDKNHDRNATKTDPSLANFIAKSGRSKKYLSIYNPNLN